MTATGQNVYSERLRRIAAALAGTSDLTEVKSLRDEAEAARKQIQRARLGRPLQNVAAEIKLRAQRRAGTLLIELIPHGGNRRSCRCGSKLRLADVGIDANQSARGRRHAAVPEAVFEKYITTANELGDEITSQGLLRLARNDARGRRPTRFRFAAPRVAFRSGERFTDDEALPADEQIRELFMELMNHGRLLAELMRPVGDGRCLCTLPAAQRRAIARLIGETDRLVRHLDGTRCR
jgi:hypothetical protein